MWRSVHSVSVMFAVPYLSCPWIDPLFVPGSRSAGTRNDKRTSFMSSRWSDDDEAMKQSSSLAEGVCFALYEVSRTCDQVSVCLIRQGLCAAVCIALVHTLLFLTI